MGEFVRHFPLLGERSRSVKDLVRADLAFFASSPLLVQAENDFKKIQNPGERVALMVSFLQDIVSANPHLAEYLKSDHIILASSLHAHDTRRIILTDDGLSFVYGYHNPRTGSIEYASEPVNSAEFQEQVHRERVFAKFAKLTPRKLLKQMTKMKSIPS